MVRPANIPLRTVRKADGDMLDQIHDDSDEFVDDSRHNATTVKKQYEGQDVRPTSTKEIYGWYSYGWVSRVPKNFMRTGAYLVSYSMLLGWRSVCTMWDGCVVFPLFSRLDHKID